MTDPTDRPPLPPPPPGAGYPQKPSSHTGLWIAFAVIVVLVLGAGGLVMSGLLGSSTKSEVRQIGISSKPVVQRIPMDGDPDYTGTTTPQFGGTGPTDPRQAYTAACAYSDPTGPPSSGIEGLHPYVADDSDDQYAHILRNDDGDFRLTASLDLTTGDVEASPDDDRLWDMGRRSTVAVCVRSPYNKSDIGPPLACTSSDPTLETTRYTLFQRRVEITVVEMLSGRVLGTGELSTPPAKCTPETDKTESMEVTDAQVAAWVGQRVEDGTFG